MATVKARETKPKTNIFDVADKAADTGTATKSKKSNIPVVLITEKAQPGFAQVLDEWTNKKVEQAKLEADITGLTATLREVGLKEWLKSYADSGKRVSSLKLTAENSGNVATFTSADAYQKVTADKATVLREIYGDDVITESKVYKLNAAMLQKYGEAISDFLMTSKKIDDADRVKIIECDKVYNVKAGLVDELPELALKSKKTIAMVVEDFGPTFQLKNA